MWIYYDTKTGNVQRFIEKIRELRGWHLEKISPGLHIRQPGHLVTFTTRIGEVPDSTLSFVRGNAPYIKSVSSSGNRNWGSNFALAADKISMQLGVPVALKFELSGTSKDVNTFIHEIEQLR